MSASILIGVDLGGTKTEVVAIDAATARGPTPPPARFRRRAPTPPGDYAGTVRVVGELVAAALAACPGGEVAGIGLGTPGSRSRATGRMKNSNSTVLNGRPLLEDVVAAIGFPVIMANDANCFALAEAKWGAGRGRAVVAGVILGTGMGGGIVVDGRVLEGPQRIAGEWGHLSVDPAGPDCYCGHRGCLETYLSGSGMAHRLRAATGIELTAPEIWKSAAAPEDPHHLACARACDNYLEWFGRGMASILNVLDPEVVVLGGGQSQVGRLYTEGRDRVRKYLFSDELTTPILPPALGDAAGVFGAALLAAGPPPPPVAGDEPHPMTPLITPSPASNPGNG
jgi:predicted NBD/HSP70 family sugar kinase